MIIPFFIPHSGCPHQCVFCNQKHITGRQESVSPSRVPDTIENHLQTHTSDDPPEVAFYGGTFTALHTDLQRDYLSQVTPFIKAGRISHIRVSTRPDCIDRETASVLKDHHVAIVELGAQSMNDDVLTRSGRGHSADDTITATGLLQSLGFRIGLQLMPGLPGDSPETIRATIDSVIIMKPEFVRLYPALVISDTMLEEMFLQGSYKPLTLEQAIATCKDAYVMFESAGIDIIRIGLQPTEELEKSGTILAGPYHPAFRQLVESAILLDRMRAAIRARNIRGRTAVFRIHPKDTSAAIGQHRANVTQLKEEFTLVDVRFIIDPKAKRMLIELENA